MEILAVIVINDIEIIAMKRIYIEGENNSGIRMAFSKLFEQELKGNMPQIILGDGINKTIDKFRTSPLIKGEER